MQSDENKKFHEKMDDLFVNEVYFGFLIERGRNCFWIPPVIYLIFMYNHLSKNNEFHH